MFAIIGFAIVFAGVLGGYMGAGGKLAILFQPFEVAIIIGAAIGSFMIGNPKRVIAGVMKNLGLVFKGTRHSKTGYIELFSMLYAIFKLAKSKGDLALESHVEKPEESAIFQQFPKFSKDHHALLFLCDYLRLLTLGTNNSHEVEAIIDEEIEAHHTEAHLISGAINAVADAMPALGIVAAVLGVINTMGSITEPPEILGHMIGGALVGTFMGVLLSYGFIAPIAHSLEVTFNSETKYYQCIKAALLAHMQGYAPQVSIEFARKTLPEDMRPTFQEVEQAVSGVHAE